MAWVKLDDQFPDHPKIEQAGEKAAWLFVCGLCYCAEHLTDGFIPESKAQRLTTGTASRIKALLKVGLWTRVDGGYAIPGYLEYQPAAEKVKADRAAAAERMRKKSGTSPELPPKPEGSSASPSPSLGVTDSVESTNVGREPSALARSLLDPKRTDDECRELDDVLNLLGDRFGVLKVHAVVDSLVAEHRRYPWPTDARKALEDRLGPVPAQAKPNVMDEAQRAQREAMVDCAEPMPWSEGDGLSPEERRARIEARRAERRSA